MKQSVTTIVRTLNQHCTEREAVRAAPREWHWSTDCSWLRLEAVLRGDRWNSPRRRYYVMDAVARIDRPELPLATIDYGVVLTAGLPRAFSFTLDGDESETELSAGTVRQATRVTNWVARHRTYDHVVQTLRSQRAKGSTRWSAQVTDYKLLWLLYNAGDEPETRALAARLTAEHEGEAWTDIRRPLYRALADDPGLPASTLAGLAGERLARPPFRVGP